MSAEPRPLLSFVVAASCLLSATVALAAQDPPLTLSDVEATHPSKRLTNADDALTRLVLPAAAFQRRSSFVYRVSNPTSLTLRAARFVIRGEVNGGELTEREIGITPAPGVSELPSVEMLVRRERIAPDHYTGKIILLFTERAAALDVPVDINVRRGAGLVILSVFAGILLGRLVQYMETRGKRENAIFGRLAVASRRSAELGDYRDAFEQMLADAMAALEGGDTVAAEKEASAIESRLKAFRDLDRLASDAKRLNVEIEQEIKTARRMLAMRADEEAAKHIATIRAKLIGQIESRTDSIGFSGGPLLVRDLEAVQRSLAQTVGLSSVQIFTGHVTGSLEGIRLSLSYWLARPLFYLALLALLLVLGVKTIYIDQAMFGARPLLDYLGAILWGMSSDIASRSLSNVKI